MISNEWAASQLKSMFSTNWKNYRDIVNDDRRSKISRDKSIEDWKGKCHRREEASFGRESATVKFPGKGNRNNSRNLVIEWRFNESIAPPSPFANPRRSRSRITSTTMANPAFFPRKCVGNTRNPTF